MELKGTIATDRVVSNSLIAKMIRGDLNFFATYFGFALLSNLLLILALLISGELAVIYDVLPLYIPVCFACFFWRHLTFIGSWRSSNKFLKNRILRVIVKVTIVFGWLHLFANVMSLFSLLKHM